MMKISQILESKDIIPGGLAKGLPDSAFNKNDLEEGIKVELEHTTSRQVAKEIAKDHLKEDPKYYKKLKKIEKPIKESPDGILKYDIFFSDSDSVTFLLLDGYYVCDRSPTANFDSSLSHGTHGELLLYLVAKCDESALDADEKLQMKDNKKLFYNIQTNLPDDWCDSDTAKKLLHLKRKHGYVDRHLVIDFLSSRIFQGRMWVTRKAISFWDYPKRISAKIGEIIDFIKLYDPDPSKFLYEVDEELYKYDDFINRRFLQTYESDDGAEEDEALHSTDVKHEDETDKVTNKGKDLKFDLSMVHTLPPNQKKQQLLDMGAKPKFRNIGSYTTFGDSLNKALDSIIR